MIRTNVYQTTDVRKLTLQKGCFSVLEYDRDISVGPGSAQSAYFAAKMGLKRRQLLAGLNGNGIIMQAGAMQIISGNIQAGTNVKGVGDFFKKAISAKVTNESAIKPHYTGYGTILFEPTYKYILLVDLSEWGGFVTIEDGLFLAAMDSVNLSVTARSNVSSALLGGEGLFNTALNGTGIVALESPVPYEELLIFDLDNDCLKIDGNMAIAWSSGLQFTVERTTKTLIGSAASGEGLVNVYRGSGRVLVAPVAK